MSKKLLIVDDSVFIFNEMEYFLKQSDFVVAGYAKSGEEALELYEKLQPDVVTMDIILPGIDGIEASSQLLKKWPDAKIVIVSSLAYDETLEEAHALGVHSFVFKPFKGAQLIEALHAAVSS